MSAFLGFRLANLLVPTDPQRFDVCIGTRMWKFDREPDFADRKTEIEKGKCHETYVVETDVQISGSRAASLDAALEEVLVLCLGLSYLSQLSVAPSRALPGSEVAFLQLGDHFPRVRAMGSGNFPVNSLTEYVETVEAFARDYSGYARIEKTRLLVHHFLDAMACWSMEDLVLSSATTLEIIAATASSVAAANGQTITNFNPSLNYAASRFSLAPLSRDFRDMRNDLVHRGGLSISKFPNKGRDDCARAAADALNWIDQYMHAALGLGQIKRARFHARELAALNYFSLD